MFCFVCASTENVLTTNVEFCFVELSQCQSKLAMMDVDKQERKRAEPTLLCYSEPYLFLRLHAPRAAIALL